CRRFLAWRGASEVGAECGWWGGGRVSARPKLFVGLGLSSSLASRRGRGCATAPSGRIRHLEERLVRDSMQRSKRERRLAGLSLTLGALGFLLVACKTPVPHAQATTVMADSAVTQAPGSTPNADGVSTTTAPLPEWRRAVFEQRWEDAAQAFDVAHPHPSQPLLRFVRARIAAELGEHDRVID